jgi:putative transposase
MPRPLRDQSAGIRHVTCRGNRRQAVFHDDIDRERLLQLLGHVCRALEWRVFAWCLMTNHFHLVIQVPAGTISGGMQLMCGDYAQRFNWRHNFTGHLFQGRFRAEVVNDERYVFDAIRYVDLNPERAGIEPWPWSSYWAHVRLEAPRPFHDPSWVRRFGASWSSAAVAYERFVDDARRRDVRTRHVGV